MGTRTRGFAAWLVLLAGTACSESAPAPAVDPVTPLPPKTSQPPMIDPSSDEAHERRGERRVAALLEACRNECSHAFRMQDPDEKRVLERLAASTTEPWAYPEEWTELQAVVARVRAREERMRTDARYLEAERRRSWVRENPMFKGVELTWVFADPYVIFQEVRRQDVRDTERVYVEEQGSWEERPKDGTTNPAKVMQNEDWARKGAVFARRDAILLTELHRRFRELFADRLHLPTLREKGRLLSGVVMWGQSSFDKSLKEAGQSVGPGVLAFYSPPQQKFFAHLDDESMRRLDEIPCAAGRVQKQNDQTLLHVGTLQLLHESSAIARGRPLVDEDTKWTEFGVPWLELGLAEMLSAVEVEEDKVESLEGVTWGHGRVLLRRVEEGRHPGVREQAAKWTLANLMRPADSTSVSKLARGLAPEMDTNMASLFECRTWAFCHFLWNYDGGRYREKFLQFVEMATKGLASSAKFATLMGRPSVEDWGPVETEFDWYWAELMKRSVGRDPVSREFHHPETDPPTGRVEDDPQFCEEWKAAHRKDK